MKNVRQNQSKIFFFFTEIKNLKYLRAVLNFRIYNEESIIQFYIMRTK